MPDTKIYLRIKEADLEKLKAEIARLEANAGSVDAIRKLSDRYADAKAALDDFKSAANGEDIDLRDHTDTIFRLAFQALDKAARKAS